MLRNSLLLPRYTWGQDYLFLATAAKPVTASIDLQPQAAFAQVDATHWMLQRKMRTGVLHQYQFYSDGKPLGNRGDAVGYNPDSYPQPGVPHGRISEQMTITSKLYDGMKATIGYTPRPALIPMCLPLSWSGRTDRTLFAISAPCA